MSVRIQRLMACMVVAGSLFAGCASGGGTGGHDAPPDASGRDATPEAALDTPAEAGATDIPETTDAAEVPGAPDAADVPGALDAVDVPESPDAADVPDALDAPDAADVPGAPDAVDVPEAPDAADVPDAPDAADARVEPQQGLCVANAEPFPGRPAASPATLPMLHQDGTAIVDAAGTPVALRGVNFGSWLMLEPWISGFGLVDFDVEDTLADLTTRGQEGGCSDAVDAGSGAGMLAYLTDRSYPEVLASLKEGMREAARPDEVDCVDGIIAWLDSIPWIVAEKDLWTLLAGRFGWGPATDLRRLYQDRWITEVDFERVAAAGLNVIRLPFWWDVFESDDLAGATFRPEGFQRLHAVLELARKHRLYVVLDMHGAPGGQSREPHAGTSEGSRLWDHPECVAKTARLWAAIAEYVKGDPHVAALDLINEPMTFPSREAYAGVLQSIYGAIRATGNNHVVAFEDGYKGPSQVPSPVQMQWTNYMFSIHLYEGGEDAASIVSKHLDAVRRWARVWQADFRCPLLIGEFAVAQKSPAVVEGLAALFAAFNDHGIHWTPWTWKHWDRDSLWGLYHPGPGFERIDVATVPFEVLQQRIQDFGSESWVADPEFLSAFSAQAASPVQPLSWSPPPIERGLAERATETAR